MSSRSVRAGCFIAAIALSGCSDEFSSSENADSGTPNAGHLVINEVDYDNPDFDSAEFVEILNASDADVDLSDIALVLVNGAVTTNKEYSRVPLAGTLRSGAYLVVASEGVSVDPAATVIPFLSPTDQIQNGSATGDALALFDTKTLSLIDALSYEGAVEKAQVSGGGNFDFVEGTNTLAVDEGDGSLARVPNGHDSDDAASDWQNEATPTPGAPNP